MKFKISSALKDHIGKELITNDNVAIFELVKNSYDAGATKVKIVFEDMRSDNPKIYIIDNGKGMSEEDIENKWLFVGYSEKKNLVNFKDNMRLMAGSKGIGRFSCDKLGSKLKITTKVKTDKEFNILELDWNNFEQDQKKEFREIPVKLTKGRKTNFDFDIINLSGTIIEITQLRGEWDWKKLQTLKRYLQRLINPLQVPEGDNFNIDLIAKDFIINDNKQRYDYDRVNGKIKNVVFEELGIKTTTIDCSVSPDGQRIKTALNDKGINIFQLEEANKLEFLKDVKIRISYLNTQAKSTFKRIMGTDVIQYGNIFVFKNGFRILPYGEPNDDWLNLNLRKTQGYKRFLGTRELLGRIEINDKVNDHFKEVTSRDGGLINNESFIQLKEFIMEFIIKRLEKYVVGAINWDSCTGEDPFGKDFDSVKKDTLKIIKQIAGSLENKSLMYNEDFLKIVEKKTIEKIPETIKNIENIITKEKDKEVKELYGQQIKSLKLGLHLQKEKIAEEIEEKEKEIEEKEKESLFLSRVLTNDEERLLSLIHIIENSRGPIEEAIKEINKKIIKKAPITTIIPFVDKIEEENNKIKLINDIAGVTGFNTKVQTIKRDLIQYIMEYLIKLRSSELEFIFLGEKFLFTYKFMPLKILIILDNLISNSRKADAKKMLFNFKVDNNKLFLKISDDSHKRIPKENIKYLFNRGFTTTGGAGIGLYSIKKMLSEMNGKIDFIGNNVEGQLNGVCFEVVIKK